MKKLVFASANPNKVKEIAFKLASEFAIIGLKDIPCLDEIPETTGTLEGNARQKSSYVFEKFGLNCFADDTGLEIEALEGKPGVNSADYANANRNADANMKMVLAELLGVPNRNAQFRTVISLVINGVYYEFQGVVKGTIIDSPRGDLGFGYDPIFRPDGSDKVFAEMEMAEKNAWSHRARAIDKLKNFLELHSLEQQK
jgi:XTP/dITP diphosphohydrolase